MIGALTQQSGQLNQNFVEFIKKTSERENNLLNFQILMMVAYSNYI